MGPTTLRSGFACGFQSYMDNNDIYSVLLLCFFHVTSSLTIQVLIELIDGFFLPSKSLRQNNIFPRKHRNYSELYVSVPIILI